MAVKKKPASTVGTDGRTEADWIGDIAHRTLERIQGLAPELLTLQQQLRLLDRYAQDNGLSSASFILGVTGPEAVSTLLDATRLYADNAPAPGALSEAVRGVAEHTGRPKQSYHNYA